MMKHSADCSANTPESALSHDPAKDGAASKAKPAFDFLGGVVTGIAVAGLFYWSLLSGHTPTRSIGLLAALCAGFAILRFLVRSRILRIALATTSVVLGGFLMAVGPRFAALDLHEAVTSSGAVAFLLGITILLRDRRVKPEVRERLVNRLVEDVDSNESSGPPMVENEPLQPLATAGVEADAELSDSGSPRTDTREVLSLAQSVGVSQEPGSESEVRAAPVRNGVSINH